MRKMPEVRPGTSKHVLLVHLETAASLSVKELYDRIKHHSSSIRSSKLEADHLSPMTHAGLLVKTQGGGYSITSDGLAELRALNELRSSRDSNVRLTPSSLVPKFTRGTEPYTGFELGRTSMRQGAYDAYDKPSLVNSERK
jgi:hypothetical protein